VSAGVFNNATPELQPVPDHWFLPALKIEADIGKTTLISNTSYYHRDEITAYQGSAYDFAYYQSQVWLIGSCGSASTTAVPPCSWYPLIDGTGIHLPPGFSGYNTPNTITNQQATWTQEIRLQSNDPTSSLTWTLGTFWTVSREHSVEELRDNNIIPFWEALFGIDPQTYYGPYYNCNGMGTPGQTLPDCDIYINDNTVHDHQTAVFGEATWAFADKWKVTLGAREAKMTFALSHHGDGFENYGPDYAAARSSDNAFTYRAGLALQADPNDLYYLTIAKGFRPGGGNPSLPAYCDGFNGLAQTGYPNGAPLTYKPDTTESYELGAKNNVGGRFKIATSVYWIQWKDIQQSVYVPYNCGLQFTDNLGTAVAKGFDVQAEMVLGAGWSADVAFGYTDARYTKSTVLNGETLDANGNPVSTPVILANKGDAISGEAAIDGGPGTNPPWSASIGLQYNWTLAGHDAFARLDYEYSSRNNWPATVQDPATTQYTPFTYTLSSTSFASLRAGMTFGNTQLSLFVDNLFDSRTITNYQLSQNDANGPTGLSQSVQQNAYTFRPRTIGLTVTYRK
jgi:outer membrane receptor protein involved in Fe transport